MKSPAGRVGDFGGLKIVVSAQSGDTGAALPHQLVLSFARCQRRSALG